MRAGELRAAGLMLAPTVSAFLVAAAGVMLLASGATPSTPSRFLLLLAYAPSLLVEASHFISSILGLVLLMLAFGLRNRVDGAWMASLLVLVVAGVLALLKGLQWEETTALLLVAALIAPFHAAFPRKTRLTKVEITPGWFFSAAAALVGVGVIGWWSFAHADYTGLSFWKALADKDAARAIRSSGAAAIVLLVIGVWRLIVTPAPPPVAGEQDTDFLRVRAILAKAECAGADANLALLGDKRFLFSESGETFLMFGVRGRSWVAVGGPVGRRDERMELLWRFREMADSHAARPALYNIGPDDLPDAIELGFAVQKTGEAAATPLEGFSVEGRKRGNLRRAWRKAGEEGASFEVLPPGGAADLMDELERISRVWLAAHSGGEKSFSMGGFEPRYISEFPIALVRQEGRPVAFATLWTTAHKEAFSIDLMRYSDDAPKNIMDYLFVELMAWGAEQGFEAFEFGVAPLAGLEDRPLAPILSRVGNLLFERGEEIYNFQGVRRYKDKYDPLWQPRYIAAPHKWQVPVLLADVGLLSSGGFAGLAKRPKKAEAA